LNSSDLKIIQPLVQRSSQIKESIVEADPFEKAERKLLNFGHSIGHAVESLHLTKGDPLSHGHAVAIGMLVESALSVTKCNFPSSSHEEVGNRIKMFFSIPSFNSTEIDEIIEFLGNDKKNQNGEFHFSLLEKIGKGVFDIPVTEAEARTALEKLNV
jgi:3-dehydroquinate synthase